MVIDQDAFSPAAADISARLQFAQHIADQHQTYAAHPGHFLTGGKPVLSCAELLLDQAQNRHLCFGIRLVRRLHILKAHRIPSLHK